MILFVKSEINASNERNNDNLQSLFSQRKKHIQIIIAALKLPIFPQIGRG